MHQSKLFEHGFERRGPSVEKDRSPVKAICISCGKERWLYWVVDGKHVCDECRRFMEDKK